MELVGVGPQETFFRGLHWTVFFSNQSNHFVPFNLFLQMIKKRYASYKMCFRHYGKTFSGQNSNPDERNIIKVLTAMIQPPVFLVVY